MTWIWWTITSVNIMNVAGRWPGSPITRTVLIFPIVVRLSGAKEIPSRYTFPRERMTWAVISFWSRLLPPRTMMASHSSDASFKRLTSSLGLSRRIPYFIQTAPCHLQKAATRWEFTSLTSPGFSIVSAGTSSFPLEIMPMSGFFLTLIWIFPSDARIGMSCVRIIHPSGYICSLFLKSSSFLEICFHGSIGLAIMTNSPVHIQSSRGMMDNYRHSWYLTEIRWMDHLDIPLFMNEQIFCESLCWFNTQINLHRSKTKQY